MPIRELFFQTDVTDSIEGKLIKVSAACRIKLRNMYRGVQHTYEEDGERITTDFSQLDNYNVSKIIAEDFSSTQRFKKYPVSNSSGNYFVDLRLRGNVSAQFYGYVGLIQDSFVYILNMQESSFKEKKVSDPHEFSGVSITRRNSTLPIYVSAGVRDTIRGIGAFYSRLGSGVGGNQKINTLVARMMQTAKKRKTMRLKSGETGEIWYNQSTSIGMYRVLVVKKSADKYTVIGMQESFK